MAEDWDNLLILDACRYEDFKQKVPFEGRLESRVSRGSTTYEFLLGNFDEREYHDTIYITANPMLERNRDTISTSFYKTYNIWQENGWDANHQTVLAETVTETARQVHERHPSKRLLVHYLQPHFPFVRSTTKFDKRIPDPDEPTNMWTEILTGELDISPETVKDAYQRNLEYVFGSVEELLPVLDGKTVISSDHGNVINERSFPIPIREWGHPPQTYIDELVKVPWFVTKADERRCIQSEDPESERSDVDEQAVQERLKNLGYV
ncbi:hypothetical protein ACFQJ7_10005 [Halovenus rubra]|uniref:Uncharacterized protein n=2 Tax=Halovenus rubra TaxID=869890 RepID=A0ACC7DW85_9EURY|nr:hypothetical protein [Halovenus rubra]